MFVLILFFFRDYSAIKCDFFLDCVKNEIKNQFKIKVGHLKPVNYLIETEIDYSIEIEKMNLRKLVLELYQNHYIMTNFTIMYISFNEMALNLRSKDAQSIILDILKEVDAFERNKEDHRASHFGFYKIFQRKFDMNHEDEYNKAILLFTIEKRNIESGSCLLNNQLNFGLYNHLLIYNNGLDFLKVLDQTFSLFDFNTESRFLNKLFLSLSMETEIASMSDALKILKFYSNFCRFFVISKINVFSDKIIQDKANLNLINGNIHHDSIEILSLSEYTDINGSDPNPIDGLVCRKMGRNIIDVKAFDFSLNNNRTILNIDLYIPTVSFAYRNFKFSINLQSVSYSLNNCQLCSTITLGYGSIIRNICVLMFSFKHDGMGDVRELNTFRSHSNKYSLNELESKLKNMIFFAFNEQIVPSAIGSDFGQRICGEMFIMNHRTIIKMDEGYLRFSTSALLKDILETLSIKLESGRVKLYSFETVKSYRNNHDFIDSTQEFLQNNFPQLNLTSFYASCIKNICEIKEITDNEKLNKLGKNKILAFVQLNLSTTLCFVLDRKTIVLWDFQQIVLNFRSTFLQRLSKIPVFSAAYGLSRNKYSISGTFLLEKLFMPIFNIVDIFVRNNWPSSTASIKMHLYKHINKRKMVAIFKRKTSIEVEEKQHHQEMSLAAIVAESITKEYFDEIMNILADTLYNFHVKKQILKLDTVLRTNENYMKDIQNLLSKI